MRLLSTLIIIRRIDYDDPIGNFSCYITIKLDTNIAAYWRRHLAYIVNTRIVLTKYILIKITTPKNKCEVETTTRL